MVGFAIGLSLPGAIIDIYISDSFNEKLLIETNYDE
jgi:hypothetical protein